MHILEVFLPPSNLYRHEVNISVFFLNTSKLNLRVFRQLPQNAAVSERLRRI